MSSGRNCEEIGPIGSRGHRVARDDHRLIPVVFGLGRPAVSQEVRDLIRTINPL